MGVLYNIDSPFAQLAKYNDGTVYSAHGETVIGTYDRGVIYKSDGTPIATYRDGIAYEPTGPNNPKTRTLCSCKNDCIYQFTTSIARFSGDQDGACAAAVLYFQPKFFKSTNTAPTYQPPLSPMSAFSEYTAIKSGLLKCIIAITIVLALLSIFQLPSVIVALMDEDINFVLLIWGIAFIYGILHGKGLCLQHLRDFVPLIKALLIPYVYAVCIQTLALCIYAAVNGIFSPDYLAIQISLLPGAFLAISVPLCTAQCIILWYIIYRRDYR